MTKILATSLSDNKNSQGHKVKVLPRKAAVRRGFKMLYRRHRSWTVVGNLFMRSAAWALRIARGDYELSENVLAYIGERMPKSPWNTGDELDDLVLDILKEGHRITGKEIAMRCGTWPQTVRASIKRLREDGHNITASMAPPRGYRLLEEDDGTDTQKG